MIDTLTSANINGVDIKHFSFAVQSVVSLYYCFMATEAVIKTSIS